MELTAKSGRPPVTKAPGKRAVVVIHGIGNQSPMQTLRSFAHAVWTEDGNMTSHGQRHVWAKLDNITGSLELRRMTTSEDKTRTRTDFFEFYYAHLLEGTSLATVFWWLRRIFWRSPARVPPQLRAPWIGGLAALMLLAAAIGGLAVALLQSLRSLPASFGWALAWAAAAGAIAMVLWILRHRVLVEFVGDAASYLSATPANIAARSAIRRSGIELLDALHRGDEYDRIIVAGHSLGSVVGYDILNFYWSSRCRDFSHDKQHGTDLANINAAAKSLRATADAAALGRWRLAQRAYARNLAAQKDRWKISDFVTMGSPLAHAHVLLVDDGETIFSGPGQQQRLSWISSWHSKLDHATNRVSRVLAERIAERAVPVCPPEPENEKIDYGRDDLPGNPRSPHHGAVFAPVRWTNIFAPRKWLLWGDVIGGPVAPLFGPGVRDVPLAGKVAGGLFAHTKYWSAGDGANEHITELRRALNLLDEPEPQPSPATSAASPSRL